MPKIFQYGDIHHVTLESDKELNIFDVLNTFLLNIYRSIKFKSDAVFFPAHPVCTTTCFSNIYANRNTIYRYVDRA